MTFFDILAMVGGLALFLYGMNTMGDGLAKLSGGKLEKILEKFKLPPEGRIDHHDLLPDPRLHRFLYSS